MFFNVDVMELGQIKGKLDILKAESKEIEMKEMEKLHDDYIKNIKDQEERESNERRKTILARKNELKAFQIQKVKGTFIKNAKLRAKENFNFRLKARQHKIENDIIKMKEIGVNDSEKVYNDVEVLKIEKQQEMIQVKLVKIKELAEHGPNKDYNKKLLKSKTNQLGALEKLKNNRIKKKIKEIEVGYKICNINDDNNASNY